MKSKYLAAIASALVVGALIAAPVTTFAGSDEKAKCEAKAKKNNIAQKNMEAYMKKCIARKEAAMQKKEMKKNNK